MKKKGKKKGKKKKAKGLMGALEDVAKVEAEDLAKKEVANLANQELSKYNIDIKIDTRTENLVGAVVKDVYTQEFKEVKFENNYGGFKTPSVEVVQEIKEVKRFGDNTEKILTVSETSIIPATRDNTLTISEVETSSEFINGAVIQAKIVATERKVQRDTRPVEKDDSCKLCNLF